MSALLGIQKLAYQSIILLLVTLFLMIGSLHLHPYMHPDTYWFLTEGFRNGITQCWEKLIQQKLGMSLDINPITFKHTVGWTELSSAILILIGGKCRKFGGKINIIITIK